MYLFSSEISNKKLSNLILILNTQQGKILNEVLDWTGKEIEDMNCKKNVSIEPLRLLEEQILQNLI